MEPKFKIGDKIWYATSGQTEKKVTCPECFGKRFLTVILGDDSQLPIPCESCSWGDGDSWGYREPYSHGYQRYYEWGVKVQEVEINRLEISNGKIEYGFHGNYRIEEDRAFQTKEEAEIKSKQLSEEHNAEEIAKIATKEKPKRTWSWNLHYHRDCIKRAEHDLAYHTRKLEAGKIKAKEAKSEAK